MRKYGFGGPGGQGFDFRNFDFGSGTPQGHEERTFTFDGSGGESGPFGGLGGWFARFFDFDGGNGSGFTADTQAEIRIPFDLGVSGGRTTFTMVKDKTCPNCGGNGSKRGSKPAACKACGGRGRVTFGQGAFGLSRPCPSCLGTGKADRCPQCGGKGTVQGPVTYSVRIPAGIEDGGRIRLKGQGPAGAGNQGAHDLFLTVRLEPHRFFRRRGDDIQCELPLSLRQAVLGSRVKVKTPRGKKVILKIPAGTRDATVFRIPRMGVERDGRCGDQLVKVRVNLPSHPSPEEKELLDRYRRNQGARRSAT
jgi:molecular chaperone DnaJ